MRCSLKASGRLVGRRDIFILFICPIAGIFAYVCLGPWSRGYFNSDEAIPILMANDEWLRPDHMFFFGQDRFGGWPFISMWGLGHVLNFRWVPENCYIFACTLFSLGAFATSRLYQKSDTVVLTGFLALYFLNNNLSTYALTIGQPYMWQIFGLLIAWLALRAWTRALSLRSSGQAVRKTLLFISSLACLLPLWTTIVSLIFLVVITFTETLFLLIPRRRETRPIEQLYQVLLSFLPIFIAYLAERLIRLYHKTSPYSTSPTDFTISWPLFRKGSERFIELYGSYHLSYLMFGLSLLGFLLVSRRAWCRYQGKESRSNCYEPGILICFPCGLVYACLLAGSRWWPVNSYDGRYFPLAFFFWGLGSVFCFAAVIEATEGVTTLGQPLRRALRILGSAIFLLAIFIAAPRPIVNLEYQKTKEIALILEEKYGSHYLLGSYWNTYLWIGMQKTRPLRPLVIHKNTNRTPWFNEQLPTPEPVLAIQKADTFFAPPWEPLPEIRLEDTRYQFQSKLPEPELAAFSIYSCSQGLPAK